MLRIHEACSGRGRVFDRERLLAEVEYSVKAVHGGRERDPGVDAAEGRSVYGTLQLSEPMLLDGYLGARLHLELDDGRTLPFAIVKVLAPRVLLVLGLADLH
jgi:hypothetical protein